MSGMLSCGERSMSSFVIVVVDAPMMPVPSRLDETSIGGRMTLLPCASSCALAACASNVSATAAPVIRS
jgi:hypothetical protein